MTSYTSKARYLIAGSAACLALRGVAHAQSASPELQAASQAAQETGTRAQDAPPNQPNPPAAPPSADKGGIAEIVVTAQKRSENLQKTPAAVTAVTGLALAQAGITDLTKVQALVPGARFQQEGNSTQVFLRGVGSNLDYGNIEPSVSFQFNGVFIPREGTSVPLFDLERLEALPGPQGTLYGRSAIGGTVNVTFQRPKHEMETTGLAEVGNYNLGHLTLTQNIPLSSNLAVRAGIDYTYHDGYMETGADSKNDVSARLSLLYDPKPDIKLYVWGYTTQKFGSPSNLVNKGYNRSTGLYDENGFLRGRAWNDLRSGSLAQFAPFGQPRKPYQTYNNWVVGAQLDIGLGHGITLTYTPGYFFLDSRTDGYWLGGIPDTQTQEYNEVTQELRLSGSSSRLKWLAGIYAYKVVNRGFNNVLVGTPINFYASHILRNRLEGLAGFGQATYSITGRLRLTAGGRYGLDDRSGQGISLQDQATPYRYAREFRTFDYKLGGEYDLARSVLAYVTYQTGYQPGTYNEIANSPTQDNAVKKSTLDAISGGLKTRFLDNRLQLNDEIFFYTYHDFAIQAYDASKAYNQIFNAKKIEIYGNQLDIILKPDTNNQLTASVSYTHARNKDFVTPAGQSFNGLTPPYAADWTAAASYARDFHVARGYVRAEADARYESEFFADYVHNRGVRQQPEVKENAAITYYADAKWSAGLWVKNLTNRPTLAATAAAGIPGPATAYLEDPRTFGLRVTFKH